MSLPPPAPNQAYCDVSALESGLVQLPTAAFIDDGEVGDVPIGPSLSFLLRNNKNNKTMVFDLGIRKDWENYPPTVVQRIHEFFGVEVPQDVSESLIKGGIEPSDVDYICLSHVHWDHVGDTTPFSKATFLVGGPSKGLFVPGYPANPNAHFATDLLPGDRTHFLDMYGPDWKPLGPFPRALDFYGDGSLYITDAAGHLPGHINVVARTSADGGWILLGGDSAHNWRLVTGESKISTCSHAHVGGCAHLDKEASEENLARMRAFMNLPKTRIILAHDIMWYDKNKGGPAFWPGKIPSL